MTGPGEEGDWYSCEDCRTPLASLGLCDECAWIREIMALLKADKWPASVRHFDMEMREHGRWLHAWLDVDPAICETPLCDGFSMKGVDMSAPASATRMSEKILHALVCLLIDVKRSRQTAPFCMWKHS